MVYLVNLQQNGLHNIVLDQLEAGMANPVLDIGARSGEKVVNDCDFVSSQREPIHKMGPDETRPARHQDSLSLRQRQRLDLWKGRSGFVRIRLASVNLPGPFVDACLAHWKILSGPTSAV